MDTALSGPVPAAAHRWRHALSMTLALLVWPATPWAQQIYKSVDAAGHVTYSDRPDLSNSTMDAAPADDGNAEVGISASMAPPELPAADQPPCPEDGDLWTPGYWAWDGVSYYWVPGAWESPPSVGVFWTPNYWAYAGTVFVFHRGYWGPHVGYYGGINYGFGYGGRGYVGGRWAGNVFEYNRAVNNVNASVLHHVYDEPVVNHTASGRVSYNGGPGGTSSVPTAQERLAAESRLPSQPERMHLQPAPRPSPSTPSPTHQVATAPNRVVSRTPTAAAPRQTVASAATPPRAPPNAASRAAATPSTTSRPRPAIKAEPIK
jgi:Domain of unknown function (DUF4124)/WXXGXW repeat (2 copies)